MLSNMQPLIRKPKVKYHKTHHAFDILGRAKASIVRGQAKQCDRLFVTLAEKMGATLDL